MPRYSPNRYGPIDTNTFEIKGVGSGALAFLVLLGVVVFVARYVQQAPQRQARRYNANFARTNSGVNLYKGVLWSHSFQHGAPWQGWTRRWN